MNYKALAEQFWNEIADEHNQWSELDKDEKIVLEYFVEAKLRNDRIEWEDAMARKCALYLLNIKEK